MTWPWKFGRNNFLLIVFSSFMCPFNKTMHTSWLSFAFGTKNAPFRNSSEQYFPTLLYEKINGILCCTETKVLSTFCFFNKQHENDKRNQYVQQNTCSFATDSGYSWRFLHSCFYILFSELTHGKLRTVMLRLQSSHSVWEAFSLATRMTQSLSSSGWIISLPPGTNSSEETPCTQCVRL